MDPANQKSPSKISMIRKSANFSSCKSKWNHIRFIGFIMKRMFFSWADLTDSQHYEFIKVCEWHKSQRNLNNIFRLARQPPHLNRDPGTEEVSITLTDTIWFTLALSRLIKPYHWTIPVDLSVTTLIILISTVFLQLSNKQTGIITFTYPHLTSASHHTFAINIWYFALVFPHMTNIHSNQLSFSPIFYIWII